jgi:hypothetical protein
MTESDSTVQQRMNCSDERRRLCLKTEGCYMYLVRFLSKVPGAIRRAVSSRARGSCKVVDPKIRRDD